jgi:hypothetical protein
MISKAFPVRRGRADICPTGRSFLRVSYTFFTPHSQGIWASSDEGGGIFVHIFSGVFDGIPYARIMRSESMELSTTIHNMGDRIQQLESAVAQAHADASDSPHPLLRDDLLGIKLTGELPWSSTHPTPAQQANTGGALAVGASGTSRYYGFSAGPSVSEVTTIRIVLNPIGCVRLSFL